MRNPHLFFYRLEHKGSILLLTPCLGDFLAAAFFIKPIGIGDKNNRIAERQQAKKYDCFPVYVRT